MGVRGLQSYIQDNFPEVIMTVNLKSLTEKFREKNPNIDPVIMVDGMGYLSNCLKDVEWLYGGQFIEIRKKVLDFVKLFREAFGITLIFFFDGLMDATAKSDRWVERRLKNLRTTAGIYSSLKNGDDVGVNQESSSTFPAGITETVQRIIQDVCKSTVFLNISGECDATIVTYALNHKCMAILGNDTDFLIYEMGSLPYLHVTYYRNFPKMDIQLYCMKTFCRITGVPSYLLPLFACLAGNDSMSSIDLKRFHQYLFLKYTGVPIVSSIKNYDVITFVLRFLRDNKIGQYQATLGKIAELSRYTNQSLIDVDKLEKAMKVYNVATALIKYYPLPQNVKDLIPTNNVTNYRIFICMKTAKFDMMPTVYQVLMFGKIERSPTLEDESDLEFDSIVYIYRPIRRRMYYLIFKFRDDCLPSTEKVYKGDTVQEIVFTTARNSVVPDVISPLNFFRADSIHLNRLWCDSGNIAQKRKLEAFLSVIGSTVTPEQLHKLRDPLKMLSILLNYLIQNRGVPLTRWEVDAFLVQAIIPDYYINPKIEVKPIARALHLSAIFASGVAHIMDVLSMCGEPYSLESASIWHFFDGKRFHYCYSALTSGLSAEKLCRQQGSLLNHLTNLRESAFEGINVSRAFRQ